MKSYTDIEQSKKLAKILPLESADMYYTTNLDCEGKIIGLLDEPLYIGSDGFVDTEWVDLVKSIMIGGDYLFVKYELL